MDWCERCGQYFVRKTQQKVVTGIAARGAFREPGVGVCDACLKYGEYWNQYGELVTKETDTVPEEADGYA